MPSVPSPSTRPILRLPLRQSITEVDVIKFYRRRQLNFVGRDVDAFFLPTPTHVAKQHTTTFLHVRVSYELVRNGLTLLVSPALPPLLVSADHPTDSTLWIPSSTAVKRSIAAAVHCGAGHATGTQCFIRPSNSPAPSCDATSSSDRFWVEIPNGYANLPAPRAASYNSVSDARVR